MKNPAAKIIKKLGGVAAVADACECDLSRVHRWTYPKERGGTDGIIPQKRWPVLLSLAAKKRIPLQVSEFMPTPHQSRGS